MKSYEHALNFSVTHPWALVEEMLPIVAGIIAQRVAGADVNPDAVAAAVKQRKNLPQPKRGATAVIPIYGVIAPRMNFLSSSSGGTSFEELGAQLKEALANDAIHNILFDVDSGGGNVAGATEFAAQVMKARTVKPIIAQVHHLAGSAAYWAIAGATQIVGSPSSMTGSIGVYTIHDDVTQALDKLGVKRTVLSAGRYKSEAVPGGALSEDAAAHVNELLAAHYGRFVKDVALGRGVKESAVRNGYGEGRVLPSSAALEAGLIDKIATIDETIERLALDPPRSSPQATGQELPLAATPQEPTADAKWQLARERELLELDI